MIKKVYGAYLSGTGTTQKMVRYIAQNLAEKIGREYEEFDFTRPEARVAPLKYAADNIVVLGTMVIAGRVPNLFLPYLKTIEGSGAYGIPVVMYGNRDYDDALIELENIMEEDASTQLQGERLSENTHSLLYWEEAGRTPKI